MGTDRKQARSPRPRTYRAGNSAVRFRGGRGSTHLRRRSSSSRRRMRRAAEWEQIGSKPGRQDREHTEQVIQQCAFAGGEARRICGGVQAVVGAVCAEQQNGNRSEASQVAKTENIQSR